MKTSTHETSRVILVHWCSGRRGRSLFQEKDMRNERRGGRRSIQVGPWVILISKISTSWSKSDLCLNNEHQQYLLQSRILLSHAVLLAIPSVILRRGVHSPLLLRSIRGKDVALRDASERARPPGSVRSVSELTHRRSAASETRIYIKKD